MISSKAEPALLHRTRDLRPERKTWTLFQSEEPARARPVQPPKPVSKRKHGR